MDWANPSTPAAHARLRRLYRAAWLCLAVHALACAAMALFIREGSPLVPPAQRAAWVNAHPWEWRLSWICWMAAAPSLVLFYATLGATLRPDYAAARRLAVALALLGTIPDVSAEYIYAFVLPAEYLDRTVRWMSIQVWERRAAILTGGLANGIYVTAGAMLSFVARATPGVPRRLVRLSQPVWIFGALLSVATFLDAPAWMGLFTGATMAFLLLWMALLLGELKRRLRAMDNRPASG